MTVALEELQDLRGVWASLSKIWTQIDDIREKPWLSVQPRKLRYFFLLCYSNKRRLHYRHLSLTSDKRERAQHKIALC